jgi:type I restriction enzyme S subunit
LSRTNKIGSVKSKAGDILIPGTSTAVKKDMILAREIDEEGVFLGGDINIIRPQKILFAKKFAAYYFETVDAYEQLEGYINGATGIIHISNTGIKNLEIPLPSITEQQHIVAVLDETFAAIAKAKANAEQNLKNAKELFESYLKGVFENKLHGSKFETLDSLCELIVDCEHKTAPTQETGYPSIRTPNIGKGVLILEGVNRVSEKTYNEWTRRAIPQADDLILAREAPAGNIAVIPENVKVCLGQRTVLIRPKKNKLISKFLAYLILSKDVQEQLLSGATVEHINMKDIRAFKIYNLSPLTEQQTIVQNLEALLTETKKLEAIYQQKINDLEELKKSVLQKAFSGSLNYDL